MTESFPPDNEPRIPTGNVPQPSEQAGQAQFSGDLGESSGANDPEPTAVELYAKLASGEALTASELEVFARIAGVPVAASVEPQSAETPVTGTVPETPAADDFDRYDEFAMGGGQPPAFGTSSEATPAGPQTTEPAETESSQGEPEGAPDAELGIPELVQALRAQAARQEQKDRQEAQAAELRKQHVAAAEAEEARLQAEQAKAAKKEELRLAKEAAEQKAKIDGSVREIMGDAGTSTVDRLQTFTDYLTDKDVIKAALEKKRRGFSVEEKNSAEEIATAFASFVTDKEHTFHVKGEKKGGRLSARENVEVTFEDATIDDFLNARRLPKFVSVTGGVTPESYAFEKLLLVKLSALEATPGGRETAEKATKLFNTEYGKSRYADFIEQFRQAPAVEASGALPKTATKDEAKDGVRSRVGRARQEMAQNFGSGIEESIKHDAEIGQEIVALAGALTLEYLQGHYLKDGNVKASKMAERAAFELEFLSRLSRDQLLGKDPKGIGLRRSPEGRILGIHTPEARGYLSERLRLGNAKQPVIELASRLPEFRMINSFSGQTLAQLERSGRPDATQYGEAVQAAWDARVQRLRAASAPRRRPR